jgi:hypothetical protein
MAYIEPGTRVVILQTLYTYTGTHRSFPAGTSAFVRISGRGFAYLDFDGRGKTGYSTYLVRRLSPLEELAEAAE